MAFSKQPHGTGRKKEGGRGKDYTQVTTTNCTNHTLLGTTQSLSCQSYEKTGVAAKVV